MEVRVIAIIAITRTILYIRKEQNAISIYSNSQIWNMIDDISVLMLVDDHFYGGYNRAHRKKA